MGYALGLVGWVWGASATPWWPAGALGVGCWPSSPYPRCPKACPRTPKSRRHKAHVAFFSSTLCSDEEFQRVPQASPQSDPIDPSRIPAARSIRSDPAAAAAGCRASGGRPGGGAPVESREVGRSIRSDSIDRSASWWGVGPCFRGSRSTKIRPK